MEKENSNCDIIDKNIEFVLICEWHKCLKTFKTSQELYAHISEHLIKIRSFRGKYTCKWNECSYTCTNNDAISRHLYYHGYHTYLKLEGKKTFYTNDNNVPICTLDTKNNNQLPELKSDFICNWNGCKQSFNNVNLFHSHVRCHCDFEFDLSKHPDVKKPNVTCNWNNCVQKFSVKYRMYEHFMKHTNEKRLACHICGAMFRTKTILSDHCKRQQANNTEEYQCAQCYKFFSSERLLRAHIKVHVNCFKCSLCDMTCNSSYTLASHVRHRHMMDRPFACAFCKRKCVTKSDLRKHISIKHENKLYRCKEIGCNYAVKAMCTLRRHIAEIHNNSHSIYACHCCDAVYTTSRALSKHLIKSHEFRLPSGHQRFTYCMNEDGIYHLQTIRIESLEVTKQILSPKPDLVEGGSGAANACLHPNFDIKKEEFNAEYGIKYFSMKDIEINIVN